MKTRMTCALFVLIAPFAALLGGCPTDELGADKSNAGSQSGLKVDAVTPDRGPSSGGTRVTTSWSLTYRALRCENFVSKARANAGSARKPQDLSSVSSRSPQETDWNTAPSRPISRAKRRPR